MKINFENEVKENSLLFPAQTQKIFVITEESGFFIVETIGISRFKPKRMKNFGRN